MITLLVETLAIAAAFFSLASLFKNLEASQIRQHLCIQFLFLVTITLDLLIKFIRSDYLLNYVYEHSHSSLPWFFKIAALWSGQEGSTLVFFVFTQGVFIFFFLLRQSSSTAKFYKSPLIYKSVIFQFILMNIYILTSDLFTMNLPFVPTEGTDLNPLLKDYAMTYHPPLLLAGQAGFFTVSILALIQRVGNKSLNDNSLLACNYLSVGVLTLGITFGSMWAYHVLGWGGYWYWDPVENISLIPWLLGLSLLHTNSTQTPHFSFIWPILLIGMIIVRSDSLISVHSFAQNINNQPVLITMFLSSVLTSIWVFISEKNKEKQTALSFKSVGAYSLASIASILIIALVAPILYTFLSKQSAHLSAQFYNKTIPPIILSAFAFISARRLSKNFAIFFSIICFYAFYNYTSSMLSLILIVLIIALSISTKPFSRRFFIHQMVLTTILLITAHSLFKKEVEILTPIEKQNIVENYTILSLKPFETPGEFNTSNIVYPFVFTYKDLFNKKHTIEIFPYQEIHPQSNMWTSKMDFKKGIFDEYCFTLGDKTNNNHIYLTIYYNPLVRLIWAMGIVFSIYFIVRSAALLLPKAILRYNRTSQTS